MSNFNLKIFDSKLWIVNSLELHSQAWGYLGSYSRLPAIHEVWSLSVHHLQCHQGLCYVHPHFDCPSFSLFVKRLIQVNYPTRQLLSFTNLKKAGRRRKKEKTERRRRKKVLEGTTISRLLDSLTSFMFRMLLLPPLSFASGCWRGRTLQLCRKSAQGARRASTWSPFPQRSCPSSRTSRAWCTLTPSCASWWAACIDQR